MKKRRIKMLTLTRETLSRLTGADPPDDPGQCTCYAEGCEGTVGCWTWDGGMACGSLGCSLQVTCRGCGTPI